MTDVELARIEAYVTRRAAEFPPLTEGQRERIRRALSER